MKNTKPRLVKETCIAGAVIDRTIKLISGSANGRRRKERKNPTPEGTQKNNDRIAIRKLTRLINANFGPGDSHLVLTYEKRVDEETALKELKKLKRNLQNDCKKQGIELKCIWATELDPRAHHHLIINTTSVSMEMIKRRWKCGRFNLLPLDGDRNYWKLADYIVKQTNEAFRDPNKAIRQRYGRTRNLEEPVIVRQPARARDFNIRNLEPIKGYQIDEDSIQEYVNPITGIPTIYYTMTAIDALPRLSGKYRGRNSRIVKDESFSRFEALRQTEFSDLFEWGYV